MPEGIKTPEENKRLAALYTLNILDTGPDVRFDRITRLTARSFDMPVALISLVDANREWFKSRHGIAQTEIARPGSFGAQTIQDDDLLIVPDTEADVRFVKNPLVTGPPHARFYAGHPISGPNGHRVGTLCIMDTTPGTLDEAQRQDLRDLAAWVTKELANQPELSETHTRYRTVSKLISDYVYAIEVKPNGTLKRQWVTDALYRVVGFTPEELSARGGWVSIVHPDDMDTAHRRYQRLLSGQPDISEFRIINKNNQVRWLRDYGKPIWDKVEQRVTHIYGAAQDITEQKEAEAALIESQHRLQALFDHAENAMLLADDKGKYIDVNPAATALTQYTRDELLEMTVVDLTPKSALPVKDNLWGSFIANGTQEGEYTLVRKDGNLIEVEYKAVANIVPGVHLAVMNDITDRKYAEEARRASEALYRAVVENQTELIWRFRPDGTLNFINQAFCRHLDRPVQALIGTSVLTYIPEEEHDRIWAQLASLTPEEPFRTGENRVIMPDGSIRWYQWTDRAFFDDQGKVIEYQSVGHDITDRVNALEALRKSQQLLQGVFDHTTAIIYVTDLQGRYLLVNRQHRKLLNRVPDEIIGKTLFEVFPPDIAQVLQANDQMVLEKDRAIQFEEMVPQNGKSRTYLSLKFPLYDANGETYAICGISTDITERKEAERQIAIFRAMAENAIDAILIIDNEQRIRYANPASYDLFGYNRALDEMVGQNVHNLWPPGDTTNLAKEIMSNLQTDSSTWRGEVRLADKTGAHIEVSISAFPILNVSGEYLAGAVTIRNITERKRAEAELHTSRERVRAVLDHALDGIVTLDENGIIESFNHAAAKLFGYTSEEILGESINILIPAEHVQEHDAHFEKYRASDHCPIIGGTHQVTGKRKDGTHFPLEVSVSEVTLGERQIFINIVRDITQRQQNEQDLHTALKAAEVASKAKSTFLATMSHELRTPLTAIIGYSEMLMEDTDYPNLLPDLERIHQAGQQLLTIIDHILDLSKIEAGHMQIELEPVSLISAIEESLIAVALLAQNKNLSLDWDLPNDLPLVMADRGRLVQILNNLVNNAVKFTPSGSVIIRTRVVPHTELPTLPFTLTHRAEEWVLISIADTGIGIAPEHQKIIFEEFQQVDSSSTRQFSGTGLGLAITRRLLTLMQGYIWVESQLGQGSTFYILLPAAQAKINLVK